MIVIGYLGFVVLTGIIVLGIPIGLSMVMVGLGGLAIVGRLDTALTQLTMVFWSEGTKFLIVSLPFYILMGNLIYHTGIAKRLFQAASYWLAWLPGGLAVASIFASAGFGAVSGSSTAATRTMGSIIIPEMRAHRYGSKLATGVMSSAGTLGMLIPPSLVLVFYGLLTETSIGKLFVAGIVPGLSIALIFSLIAITIALLHPDQAGRTDLKPDVSLGEKLRSLLGILPVAVIFGIVLGGIHFGITTPTESSVIGVVSVLVYGTLTRCLTIDAIKDSLISSIMISVMLFLIIAGGALFSRFLAQTGFTASISNFFITMQFSYWQFILVLTLLYIVMGFILDTFGMIALTVPFVYPIAMQLGIDPVWLGIYLVIVAEIGLITPPLGINVFIIHTVAKDVKLWDIFLGCIPFIFGMLTFVAIIATFPQIVLFLID